MRNESTGALTYQTFYRPFVYNYGFDFIDGALVTPGLPTSYKYNLFLLSCLQDVACGFIQVHKNPTNFR